MSILYKNIISLCEERGIKGGKMCTDIGMSKGILTDLKMGRQTGISAANAQKIAAYFGVSVGYLLGEEEQKEKPTVQDDGLSEKQKAFIEKVMQMSDAELDKLDKILALVENTN
jgi:transcriptional regulator with XRE-family HTH domain